MMLTLPSTVRRVFLDMDEVLVALCKALWAAHGIEDPYLNPANLGIYNIEMVTGMGFKELWKPATTHEFWESIEWCHDGKTHLEYAETVVGRDNVWILTHPMPFSECYSGKVSWIYKNLPYYYMHRIIMTPHKYLLARPDSLLIDDCDQNIHEWTRAGGMAMLVPRPWNMAHSQHLNPIGGKTHVNA